MSSIVISGDTSGSITLNAPSAAGSTTLSLPASTGNVLADSTCGVCRAWVNFNGIGTVAINAAFNVSSITDNGIGDYTVNFTSAMPDNNFVVTGTCSRGSALTRGSLLEQNPTSPNTTSSARVRGITVDTNPGLLDCAIMAVAIFR